MEKINGKKKWLKAAGTLAVLLSLSALGGCGSGAGGTETGTTDNVDVSELATRIESVASSLVPLVDDSDDAGLRAALTYGSSSDWNTYLEPDNLAYLEEIFGDPDSGFAVVTKLRVLLDQFQSDIRQLFTQDPDVDCTGASVHDFGDDPTVAFYGTIDNGSAEDRFYDCLIQDATSAVLYGRDAGGVIRIVQMSDETETNTEEPGTRGDEVSLKQVIMATYAETEEDGETVAYLDIQYAQGTLYNGVDSDFAASDDNMVFKSRSRITGRAAVDDDGAASAPAGQFTVTKYDRNPTDGGGTALTVTETLGRGDPSVGGHFLFEIDSDAGGLAAVPGTYCLEMGSSGTPAHADSSNCTALETAVPWDATLFPFSLDPTIGADFEAESRFDGSTDLISDTGTGFTIPSY